MKINLVTILNARMEESIRFYTEVMGFEVARDFAAAPGRRIVFLADGPGTMIELIADEGVTERASGDISIGFHVDDIEAITLQHPHVEYGDFIRRTFENIYFTNEENRWLDVAVGNIQRLTCPYKRALAWFAVFQSAMAKRPPISVLRLN